MHERPQVLRVVVASPQDVKDERDLVAVVVNDLNAGIAVDRGLRLEVARWETDSYPGFHVEGPQGLIDEVLRIEDSTSSSVSSGSVSALLQKMALPVQSTKFGGLMRPGLRVAGHK